MEFTSPRFAGNIVLEEILNDPNTGTKKLAKGSPSDAVSLVQRALRDLHWVASHFLTASGGVLLASQFVDGDYGPWTTATVLAYKRHYDIHFPPDAPVGTFDGFTGPTTLKWLDVHCTLLDEAAARIIQHVEDLHASGASPSLQLGEPDGLGRTTRPIRRSAGAQRHAMVDGAVGALVYKRDIGAFALHSQVFLEWVIRELAKGSGDSTGEVGFPTSDAFQTDTGSAVLVERGQISHDATTGISTFDLDPDLAVLHHDMEF
ncbi:MAG TPA: hypothetical protein VES21_09655 [Nocardioidaceae bacterium]|nr:hypothetical protein [Nocardioidaceae bacterium]